MIDWNYAVFGGGWSLGYSVGTVVPAFASGGGSVLQKGLSSSRKLQRLVDAVDSAVPDRVPNGVKPGVLRRAGKIDDTLPDTDVQTGRLSGKLAELPDAKQSQVTESFDELSDSARRYLGDTEIDSPATKTADLFETAGPGGRRALDALSETDDEAADILLKIDDPETQWRFARAFDEGEASADELADALRRYDGLSGERAQRFEDLLAVGGEDAVVTGAKLSDDALESLLDADVSDGARARALRTLRDVDADRADRLLTEIGDLSELGQRNAIEFLGITDRQGVRMVDEFDRGTARRFFELDCAGPVGAGASLSLPSAGSRAGLAAQAACVDRDLFRRAVKQSFVDNGNVDVGDAADVVDTVTSLSGQKQQRAALLVRRARGEGGAEFLADADRSTIDDVLSFEVDTSGTDLPADLQERVRVGLAQSYSRNHFSLDGWAGDVYPEADGPADVASRIAQDIDDLNDNEAVEGLAGALSRQDGGGAYLTNLPSPGASNNPVKGVALELRVARQKVDDLQPGETLRLSYEPDVDFTDLAGNDEALKQIARKVYGSEDDVDLVKDALGIGTGGKRAELDSFRMSSSRDEIYFESKNRKSIEPEALESQAVRFFAAQKLRDGGDLADSRMTVFTRTSDQAATLNDEIDLPWFTAKTVPESSG